MLLELRVENLLLIERAELSLSTGLNVLTGETGAGKTVLAHALDLLLGGRARAGIVRPGAEQAYVEGVFDLSAEVAGRLAENLPETIELDGCAEIILARRVGKDGRTRAYVNGRAITVSDLREIGPHLISFYGQHEHRKLTLAAAQLEILDGFCGAEQSRLLERCALAHQQVGALQRQLGQLNEINDGRERELELLEHELSEIQTLAPDQEEYEDLRMRREQLKQLDTLAAALAAAGGALNPTSDQEVGATELLARGAAQLEALEDIGADLRALSVRYRQLLLEAEDLASDLRHYGEDMLGDPRDLDSVEDRLSELERLMRKHGQDIPGLLAHAEHCSRRVGELRDAEVSHQETSRRLQAAINARDVIVEKLRMRRERAAPRLAKAVRERLTALAMPDACFHVELGQRTPGRLGADSIEFTIATNPGVQAGPLREIASGGELSRVMLALMSVANAATSGAEKQLTLVFDEVDAGIGGHTARSVGESLRELSAGHQILCITHLAQIASLATKHFSVVKDTSATPTKTTVVALADSEVVSELVRMLGASEEDVAARTHASELRRAA